MTGVLGLVGSARPWGNSELLVRRVLQGALDEGATAGLVRLTDLHLEPCTGCMRCVLGGKACPLEDDMVWLLDALRSAEGLVIAAPTYFLGPAAVVKLVLDRLLMVTGRTQHEPIPPRPSVTLVTAGLESWRGIALPYLNALAAALGFQTIDSLTAIAPGPGEVLLNEALMDKALILGNQLGRGDMTPAPVPAKICPVCRCDSFVLSGRSAVCPVCGSEATIELAEDGLRLAFVSPSESTPRWTPDGLRAHMVDWVMATGPRFLAHRQEVKARRAKYREMEVEWLHPPSAAVH